MADTPISGLVALATINANASDLLVVVDVADTTMSTNGSDKKITWGNFLAASAGDVGYSGFNSTVGKVSGSLVQISSFVSPITAEPISNSVTLNAAVSNWHGVTLNTNTTLAITNSANGQQFTTAITQSNGGSHFVTWWNGILWAGGSPPTLTTTNAKTDIFTFKQYATNSYWGMVAGQNF